MSEDVEKDITKNFCELQIDGSIWWCTRMNNNELDLKIFNQGNRFNSVEAAEKERDRRNLLARVNRFRDEKNDGWIPKSKFCIYWISDTFIARPCDELLGFNVFGYFKNRDDCLEAISRFGHEVYKLFVEE